METHEELQKEVGTKEPQNKTLEPKKVKIVEVNIVEVGEKKNKKVNCFVQHPDSEKGITISSAAYLRDKKIVTTGLWYNLDSEENIQKGSAVAIFLNYTSSKNLKELEGKEVETELAEIEKKLLSLKESYLAIKDKLEKTWIKAPEDGIVMNLRVHTIGGVIMPGEPIMEIVPKDAELIVEAKLSPIHIEEVKVGQPVDLRFIALDPKKTPVLTGMLIYVSPDILIDEKKGYPYYLVKAKIDKSSMKEIQKLNKEITPGMPVQVIIKTGKRTFLSYLLKPFIDRLSTAFLK